jgi:hypothetical protein
MRRSFLFFAGTAILGLQLGAPSLLGGCTLDLTSRDGMLQSGKCFGFFAEAARPKKAPVPGKVAIAAFQVRYELQAPGGGFPTSLDYGSETVPIDGAQRNFFDLELADYDRMTGELYDRFVDALQAHGVVVSDVEAVKNSATYKDLKPDNAVLYKEGSHARGSAHGLKNLKPKPMQFQADKMAGITHELGVDAVLTVFFHLGLAAAPGAAKGQVRLSVGSLASGAVMGASPLEITALAGVVEEKKPGGGVVYLPRWKARFGVAKAGKEVLVYQDSLREPEGVASEFSGPERGKDVERYVMGARSMMGIVADVALAHWDHAVGR